MDLNSILIPGIVVGTLGGFFALILAIVARYFAVKHDPKLEELSAILPGLNCGGCGYPNCFAYAEALYGQSDLPVTMCKPGGAETAADLGACLGRAVGETEKTVAKLFCRGGRDRAHDSFKYIGPETCLESNLVRGGYKQCKQACLGFGDCYHSCKFDAIQMGESGLPIIDREKCVACGACVEACPRDLIKIVPAKSRVHVECSNTEKGPGVTKACEVGCIACGLCVKECPVDAIHVVDNIAVIDYDKCISCGKCVKVCPRNIILQLPRVSKA